MLTSEQAGDPLDDYTKARTDSLTGLANRLWLEEQLPTLIRSKPGNFGVIMGDLDGLKRINDTHGHLRGDEFIVNSGAIIQLNLRSNEHNRDADTARLGGDEFVIVLSDISEQSQVDAVIERLETALDESGIGASFGGRVHRQGEDAFTLMNSVDSLMYRRKVEREQERLASLSRRKRLARKLGQRLVSWSRT